VDPFALTAGAVGRAAPAIAAAAESTGLQINLFWIIVATANFLLLLVILWLFAWGPLTKMLDERRRKVEQGLRDAETARRDRELAESERLAALNEARREANEIIARAQRVAQETRDADIAATREELDRMRVRAAAEIDAEKGRAIADLRAEVADLAINAAGRVVRASMDGPSQRRLVEEFLAETGTPEARA
jgi:F-type H+-transporting ATPase subunit b